MILYLHVALGLSSSFAAMLIILLMRCQFLRGAKIAENVVMTIPAVILSSIAGSNISKYEYVARSF